MPRLIVGMKLVCVEALVAASGPAMPSMAPRPKRRGSFATFFSVAYEMNDAMVGPVPGRMPNAAPMAVPRTSAPRDCLMSPASGRMDFMLIFADVTLLSLPIRLMFFRKSATPNRPMASATICRPSDSSRMPK